LRERAGELLDASPDEGPDAGSLLARLASLSADPESAFDREEVLDQVVGMLFAGHETTALSMTYALHAIGSHPTVARRFHGEIDDALEGTPTTETFGEMPYLKRVIDETLRLYPPVHAIPRVTTRAVELGEYTVPADAQVLLSVWSLHRDPRFYDDPGRFDPGRWQDTSPRDRGYTFLPFGAGPRICIGRHLARLELQTALSAVGRRYRVESETDLTVTPQMTTQPDGPVSVTVRER
jgi:cytochrome P450